MKVIFILIGFLAGVVFSDFAFDKSSLRKIARLIKRVVERK